MTPIEVFILIILLLLSVPDLCERLGRPALLYTVYLLVGMAIGPMLKANVSDLLTQIGHLGFILLLFEIGLEIDLPHVKSLMTPARLAVKWVALQFPVIMGIARFVGLSWTESFLAATALNGCSVSMTFLAWQYFAAPKPENKRHLLLWMVTLEIMAIIILTAGSSLLTHGFGLVFAGQLVLIAAMVILISRFADQLAAYFGKRMASTVRMKGHYIVLFIFLVAAMGNRLGLSESKTAFFLGLFISRATHEGIALEHHLRPISQHLLIPVFFVSLGAFVPVHFLVTRIALLALVTTAILLLLRDILHRTWVKSGCDRAAFLLVCPNLTIVAIAASLMHDAGTDPARIGWIVLTGLLLSIVSVLLVPQRRPPAPATEPSTVTTDAEGSTPASAPPSPA